MRSPLDPRFKKAQELMKTGQMVGVDRPVGRVTWAKGNLLNVNSQKPGVGTVRFLDKTVPEHEIPSIKSIQINRSIGQDSASCTIVANNIRADSSKPDGVDTGGSVGYLTPGRGTPRAAANSVYNTTTSSHDVFGSTSVTYPTAWGYSSNPYRDVFIPNTIIRTYQGYGSDNFDATGNDRAIGQPGYVRPGDDSKLYMTGLWLIDKVTFSTDGTMSIECRDAGKLLIEQYIYPPMIPVDRFPLIYCPAHQATGHKESIGRNVATFHSSSVDAHYGRNASIGGHRGSHAFDGQDGTLWLSGPDESAGDVEWLQGKVHGEINEIVLNTYGGNYIAFVCVHENGRWQGSFTVSGTTETGNRENLTSAEGNGSGGFFYVVTKGDTLWDLAGHYYGDHFKWPIIAQANNNIIKDPHWIYPGQRIKIPYVAGTLSPPPGASAGTTGGTNTSIPYVMLATIPASGRAVISLPRNYKADYIRIVFTNLQNLGAAPGSFRAGVRTLQARNHVTNTYIPSTLGKAGFIQDWTEPIKEMCAWAGLTWVNPATPTPADPVLGTCRATDFYTQGVVNSSKNIYPVNDVYVFRPPPQFIPPPIKPVTELNLRVWGDFENLGAGPVVCTPGDYFLSKSFMDGIRLIVDFIGGIFFVDESGGAQFRLPNIWTGGNFIDDTSALSSLGARFNDHPIEFHEDANLVEYEMVISDQSVRSEVLVIGGYPSVNASGPIAGGYVLGYNSETHQTSAIDFSNVLAGQYRLMIVPGDATKLFYTEAECQRMAELTALFILFTYRQGTLKAPCHPGLQIDDQVRIFERITNESYIHYVSSIDTHQDLETGEYTMQVTTHWLGSDPDTDWFIDKAQLTPAVKELPAILKRVGKTAGGGVFEQPPYGVSG